ncbi:MAG: transporter [Xanthobacteraceae bacterium]
MMRLAKATLYGAVSAAALTAIAGPSFAIEAGDFNSTLRGATIGVPLGAAPPPGVYGDLLIFQGIDGRGTGQNNGISVFGDAFAPALVWAAPGKFLGASYTAAVIQPFFEVTGWNSFGSASTGTAAPLAFGNASFFENMHNTIIAQALHWNLGQGWFAALGVNVQGPDGSLYNGTLNDDYWTVSPTAAIAYLSKDWKIAVNFDYDIHGASQGHTGTYAALAAAGLFPSALAQQIGNGWTSGQQAFVDWSVTRKMGKWEFGPVGYFKWQTTADTPGGGFTCAQLTAALGSGLSCGNDTDIAVGGLVGYDFGPVNLQAYVTKSVYTKDDFGTGGLSAWGRISFKIWGAEPPMYKKAVSAAD